MSAATYLPVPPERVLEAQGRVLRHEPIVEDWLQADAAGNETVGGRPVLGAPTTRCASATTRPARLPGPTRASNLSEPPKP